VFETEAGKHGRDDIREAGCIATMVSIAIVIATIVIIATRGTIAIIATIG
jgi:hypothetical protein